jgi:two-component system nitrate/nitrite sensor histidine kinase NarX
VQLHQRLLGEVTLFYRTTLDLSPDMRELLSTMARHLASAMEGLRATALEREAAVAEERSLIARELHDSIAQSLAFLKIQTQLLRDAVAKGNAPRATAAWPSWTRACASATPTCASCWCTFARAPGRGHRAGAARHAVQVRAPDRPGHHADMAGQGLPLAPDVQIQVLHIVQEALSNVRKHAGAHVQLRVQRHPLALRGARRRQGFDPRAVPPTLHVGLGIMRERAQRIGAGARGLGARRRHARASCCRRRREPSPRRMTAPITLFLVDDHTLFRRGLIASGQDDDLRVVGEAATPARRCACAAAAPT